MIRLDGNAGKQLEWPDPGDWVGSGGGEKNNTWLAHIHISNFILLVYSDSVRSFEYHCLPLRLFPTPDPCGCQKGNLHL